jgi:ParB-like chromosome segregation protein Spo0J
LAASKAARKFAPTKPARAGKARQRFRFHPLANLLPLLEGDEPHRLAEDIRENGLLEPILLTPEGRILDGRNRFRACRLAKIAPRFETIREPEEKWLCLVVSRNIRRRHLTPSQTAAFAAELVTTSHGANQHAPRGPGNSPSSNSLKSHSF